MTLTRWDPFHDLVRIQERMNRLFEDSMRRPGPENEGLATGTWSPSVDIYETPEHIVLLADLPGVERSDIEIRVENNTLTLRGERRMTKDVQQESYHRVERAYGVFSRSFSLPATVDQDNIKAEHKNGILEVHLPKTEGARPKRIRIDVAAGK